MCPRSFTRSLAGGLLASWLLLAGCAPEVQEGFYGCAARTDCPDGWHCRDDGRCWRTPGSPTDAGGPDGGPRDGGPDGGPRDGGPDGGPRDGSVDGGPDGCVPASPDVDLLVMVDRSGSMTEEQEALTGAFPQLVGALATGDVDRDGRRDFAPVDSLHVGVITSDLGALGNAVRSCDTGFGDDAALVTAPSGTVPGCDDAYPSFLEFSAGDSVSSLADDFTCVATVGVEGCGFEQQLESVLKAISPSDSTTVFFDGSLGQGDRANAGFLREDSLLLTLLVTDEEDCSTLNPDLFRQLDGPYAGIDLNHRCYLDDGALTDVSRYVAGLREVRPDTNRLAFAALVGMPPELHGSSYGSILADDRMDYVLEPMGHVAPACTSAAGNAMPGRRYVELARALEAEGAATLVRSICTESFESSMEALLTTLAPRLAGSCE